MTSERLFLINSDLILIFVTLVLQDKEPLFVNNWGTSKQNNKQFYRRRNRKLLHSIRNSSSKLWQTNTDTSWLLSNNPAYDHVYLSSHQHEDRQEHWRIPAKLSCWYFTLPRLFRQIWAAQAIWPYRSSNPSSKLYENNSVCFKC